MVPVGSWVSVGKLTIGERFDGGIIVVVVEIGVVNIGDGVPPDAVVVVVVGLVVVIVGIVDIYIMERVLFGKRNWSWNPLTLGGGWSVVVVVLVGI